MMIDKRIRIFVILVSVISSVLFSCKKKSELPDNDVSDGNNIETKITSFDLVISDSIVVDLAEKLIYCDYSASKDKLLFVSSSNRLILTDISGKILNTLDLSGESNEDFGRKFHHASFDESGDIIVISERGLNFFSPEGKFIKRVSTKPMIMSTVAKGFELINFKNKKVAVIEPQESVMASQDSFDANTPSIVYYLKTFKSRAFVDIENGETIAMFFGNEPGSIFLNFDHRYRDQGWRVFFYDKDSTFNVINNPEKYIYVYRAEDDYALSEKIPLSPDNFKYPLLFDLEEFSTASVFNALKYNSNFISVGKNENYFFVQYREGVSESNSDISVQDAIQESNNFLMILDHTGNKLTKDIKLPSHIREMFMINGEIYFHPKRENPNYEVFYKVNWGK